MSDCATRFEELTRETDTVLAEDLAALQRLSEPTRIERYDGIKRSEESFVWEFSEDCPEFLTDEETARVRGNFRLARLLIAASFYADDGATVPPAMADDFVEAELQAVVDFDRYKQFDALTESQIEERIRRMEGEVYELVDEYTSTQIADMDALIENQDVQQDLVERLVARYEERREKIRHGFFVYVETHGLEHMVAAIEEAVTAVAEAEDERERVADELRSEVEGFSETLDSRVRGRYREAESELRELEGELASGQADPEAVRARLETVASGGADGTAVPAELRDRIERTSELGERIEERIADLEAVEERARDQATEQARPEAVALVENELDELRDQRAAVSEQVARLERECERVETAREALEDRQADLESRVDEIERSVGDDGGGVDGDHAVTAAMARMLEMDYLGRFDISMAEADSIRTRDGTVEIPDGYWEGRSERRSERSRLSSWLDEGEDPKRYPTNAVARYEITDERYLGLATATETVVAARVLADLRAHATNGFDASPATLDDLLSVVNEAVYEAERGEHGYLLAVASPTGWSERVREQVETADVARSRYSKYVSVCLVDLQDGSLVYDESDPVARENADLFAPPVDAERVDDCVATVRREYVEDVAHESVLLTEVAERHGYDEPVVKRAFNELEAAGAGEQLYLDELGLSLECGT
ncbi:hypothetical protein [Halosimplex marinum]|uniref:hypothetical protein n=1 Tax=Halosimplex marinum TaxID=3396620 RepID=UPI003F56E14A